MREKKIKLLYVVNARIPNNKAHSIQIVHTCQALGSYVDDFTLITPKFVGKKVPLTEQYAISQSFSHIKIPALDIPKFPFQFQLRSATFFICVNFYILLTFLVSLCTGKRLVVYARGEVIFFLLPLSFFIPIFFETHQIRNYEGLYKMALHRVRGVIVITNSLEKKFVQEYKIDSNKISVARDAVDIQKFNLPPQKADFWEMYLIPRAKKIILYCGSLAPEKGVHTLAEASQYLPPEYQVVFIGGDSQQVASFKTMYGTKENISILGYVDHKTVPSCVAAASLLILPDLATDTYSNLYTSPMKLFEYMASGRVIISSDIPSLREVLEPSSAVFFESGNSEDLSIKIYEVFTGMDTYQQKGKKAQEVVAQFTWQKRAGIIVELIKKRI